jgi:hypothetical protein
MFEDVTSRWTVVFVSTLLTSQHDVPEKRFEAGNLGDLTNMDGYYWSRDLAEPKGQMIFAEMPCS